MASKLYDFIIVGGGTSGCLLAHRLANTPSAPSVLVLEAGGNPSGDYLTAPFHKYSAFALRPDLDHGHVSEAEPALAGRQIPYTRGKGLGGSSVVNFGVYLYGSKEDYNRWAELVGDDAWRWEEVKKSFHAIEDYDFEASSEYKQLADASTSQHGTEGRLKVGLPTKLEPGVKESMEAVLAAGDKINLDPNSGDPVGVSVFPHNYSKKGRMTSAMAHLVDAPSNLEVWTDASVSKFVWQGNTVVGVETLDGRKATSSKEVIISAGAIDTPKLLLLNGIGPKEDLSKHNVEVKTDLPGVGQHLQDHVLAFMSVEVDGSSNDRYAFESNEKLLEEAQKAWEIDQSGAFAIQQSCLWGGFLKLPTLQQWPEFQALPKDHQEFLTRDAVPTYEFINNSLLWPPGTELTKGNTYMTCIAFLMNPQSEGSVSLRSADPNDKPNIKLNFLTHPYDKRQFREAIRSTWTKIVENPTLKKSVVKTLCGPASLSDEDIDAFARDTAGTVWHACGSAKMGKAQDPLAVVDSSFRVRGVHGLRVVDMSVAPLTTNNHTQATAYLVGQKASERLIWEYNLDGKSRL